MPSAVASQFAASPWPEHASSRVREQLYEQSELAKPASHTQPVMPLPSAEQSVAHYQLASLRRGRGGAPGRKLYSQPAGRLFDLVSCPHYLTEILLYAGVLAVAAEGLWQPKATLLLVWLGTNLGSAAHNTHTWYRRKFEGYPPGRKALVPYLW